MSIPINEQQTLRAVAIMEEGVKSFASVLSETLATISTSDQCILPFAQIHTFRPDCVLIMTGMVQWNMNGTAPDPVSLLGLLLKHQSRLTQELLMKSLSGQVGSLDVHLPDQSLQTPTGKEG